MNYTKRDLLSYFLTQYQLAKFLKITHQAVGQWPMDEPVPELRRLQLEQREREWKNKTFVRAMRRRVRAESLG